jgi:DNA (cytosine-5)-methyltransferase 1
MAKINAFSKKAKYTAVSFFSGMGGASIGMKMAGFKVVYANEFVPVAADAYEANSNIKVDREDVRKVDAKRVYKLSGIKPGELDLLEGSPPCKAFSSTQARKKGKDFGNEVDYSEGIKQRVDDLFFEFCRILKQMQPKVFIAENVPGLVKAINRGYFVEIHKALADCGYYVQAVVIDPSRLGVPQKRERLILQGVRNDLVKAGFMPAWCKPAKYETTVQECLPHIERIKSTRGYIHARTPSPTITASDHSIGETANFSCGGYCEDNKGKTRKYTIDELKVLSSVPSDFVFPRQEKETDKKHFQRSWERLGRIHVPLQVYHITKAIREQIIEPFYLNKGKPYVKQQVAAPATAKPAVATKNADSEKVRSSHSPAGLRRTKSDGARSKEQRQPRRAR